MKMSTDWPVNRPKHSLSMVWAPFRGSLLENAVRSGGFGALDWVWGGSCVLAGRCVGGGRDGAIVPRCFMRDDGGSVGGVIASLRDAAMVWGRFPRVTSAADAADSTRGYSRGIPPGCESTNARGPCFSVSCSLERVSTEAAERREIHPSGAKARGFIGLLRHG